MRSAVRFSSRLSLRGLFAVLFAVCLVVPAVSQTTTFSGTVYSPFGPTKGSLGYAGDPIPNILVFVQDSFPADIASGQGTIPPFTQGVNIPAAGQSGCSANPQTALVPKTVLGSALTTSAGTFTFNVTGQLPDPVVIVIQAGKWRKQYSYPLATLVPAGLQLTMPSAQVAGPTGQANIADLPHIAVVTGDADQVECIFQQIGIAGTEITDPSGKGSINLFEGDGAGGSVATTAANAPKESQLLNPAATNPIPMTNYDLVIFGCQGSATADADTKQSYTPTTITNYTADSGRILLTHYEWPFVNYSFPGLATWFNASNYSNDLTSLTGDLNPNYSGYATLEGWMSDIGALTATAPNATFQLPHVRQDVKTITSAAVDVWATIPSLPTAGSPAIQFSFDTPLGQTGTPTVTVAYTNNTMQFVAGDTNDTITVDVTNTGTVATSGTALSLSLQLPSSFTNIAVTDPTGGWSCPVTGSVANCTHQNALGAGASDSVVITFGISATAAPGPVSISSTISGGNLNNSEQCGRVLFNDYHVEEPSGSGGKTGSVYALSSCPAVPASGLSAAQKFLEYSLYALSNFVSPSTADAIQILVKPTVAWTPTTPVYYGTPLSMMETGPTATVAGTNIAGTFSYSYTPNIGVTPLDVGTYTFTATFTPTDTTDYLSSSASAMVTVLQDPTQAIISNLSGNIYYGQEIGYDAKNGNAKFAVSVLAPGYTGISVTTGTYSLSVNGTVVCSGTPGVVLSAGNGPNGCSDAGFAGLNAGTYALTGGYTGTNDFASSTMMPTSVVINPDPTSTTITASSNASVPVHTNVTFTASTADVYTPAVGTINFYDSLTAAVAQPGTPGTPNVVPSPAGATLIGSQPLTANGTVTLSLANLSVGTHNIVACFVGPQNSSSTYNFVDSCSASVPQVITVPPTAPLGTQTLLTTSVNPAALGQAISFTATVSTTGAFTQPAAGTVTFTADGSPLGSATVAANGTAVVTTSALALGTHAIVATYGGSSTMATSVSTTLSELVQEPLAAAGTGFILNVTPTTLSVPVGGSAVVTIQVVELTDFNQPVALTCSGLPDQTTCVFAQSTIPSSGGTTQLLVTAAAPHNCNSSNPYFVAGNSWGWPLFGMSMLTLFAARKRKKLQAVALVAMLMALPTVLTGCGGGNCTDFGVKPGAYSFTITATSKGSPSVVKSQTMTMNAHL